MAMDRAIASLARGQNGVFSLSQAAQVGCTPRQAQHRLETGRWERVHAGVYRAAGAPRSWEQEVLAACLAAGSEAVASHRTAACMWQLDGVPATSSVEITVPLPQYHRRAGVVVHRSSDLSPEASTHRDGIPVTTPARTLLDLGAVVAPRRVEMALDSALSRRLVTVEGLGTALEAIARRGRRGVGVLRVLLEQRSDAARLTESVLEARMLRLLRGHSLPEPTPQYEVRVGQRLVGRVDFAYPRQTLAIEVDGYASHSSLAAFGHDRARQNALVAAGWTVLRFTWHDLAHRPEAVTTAVRRVLCASSNRGGEKSRKDRWGGSGGQPTKPSGSRRSP